MIADVLCAALSVYTLVLFAEIVLSWALVAGFRPPVSGPLRFVVDGIGGLTRPVLGPIRDMIPPLRLGGVGLDLSVLVVFVAISILRRAIGC